MNTVVDGFTLEGMSMVIELPDEMVRRLTPVAAARGETIEAAALEALDVSPLLADLIAVDDNVDLLEAFIGCGTSDGSRPTEIHEMRRDLAARRWAAGIENL